MEILTGALYYLSLTAGASMIGGNGVQTVEDCNPKNLPLSISDTSGIARIAFGMRKEQVGLEVGYGKLGQYHRSVEFTDPGDDTVGEDIDTQALDFRAALYLGSGTLKPYLFGKAALVFYQREAWTGHHTVNGVAVTHLTPATAEQGWQSSSGTSFGAGGGVGLEWKLSQHVRAIAEYGALFGEFQAQTLTGGLRWMF